MRFVAAIALVLLGVSLGKLFRSRLKSGRSAGYAARMQERTGGSGPGFCPSCVKVPA